MEENDPPNTSQSPEAVIPEIIITQPRRPRLQFNPLLRRGMRVILDLDPADPNAATNLPSHTRHSSYYATHDPPPYPLPTAPTSSDPDGEATMEPLQQRIPAGAAPTGPRHQHMSHPNPRVTDVGATDLDSAPVPPPTNRRASRSRRDTTTSRASTTRRESHTSQMPKVTIQTPDEGPETQQAEEAELPDEFLMFTDPEKYRRKQIQAQRAASGIFLPSVLDPKATFTETSYDEAISAITKETGPLLKNLKSIPSRPVDLVLYDSRGCSLAVFTLLLTKDVDLLWLISWIQVFVDKWVNSEKHPEMLVVLSVKIRMASRVETERYPPLQGTAIDRTQNEPNGPFKDFYFVKWDCHDSQMEKYWEVYRCMLQMGASDPQKPIFKVYTVGFPLATAPVNLRDQKSLAPGQYFQNKKTRFPLRSEDFYTEAGDKLGYTRMASSSEAAFMARELKISGDTSTSHMGKAPITLPSVSNAPYMGAESYGARASDGNNNPSASGASTTKVPQVPAPQPIRYHGMELEGSDVEKAAIKDPRDEWATVELQPGNSVRILAPYRAPMSNDPTRVWSYYQRMGGGDNAKWKAFNMDHVPFETDQFEDYEIINDVAVPLSRLRKAESDNATATGKSPGDDTASHQRGTTDNSSPNLGVDATNTTTFGYGQSPAVNEERLSHYQKEFEAARGFDSEDDDKFFPKRGQPPSPPRVSPKPKPKERWFQKKSSALSHRGPATSEKEMPASHAQRKFPATGRKNDAPMATFTQPKPMTAFESSSQHFSQWENPSVIHGPSATETLKPNVTSSTAMNPDAPSFQAQGQPASVQHLNANAPAFQQSTTSIPPHRIIPPGYGDLTPLSGMSPTISRVPSQVSLNSQNFRSGPQVDRMASGMSNLNTSGYNDNSRHNFDHFSRLQQTSPPEANLSAYGAIRNANYRPVAPALGNSFRSVAHASGNDGSSFQYGHLQNQARNPHINTLNQRLQSLQIPPRERPDRSRTFDRENRPHSGNRGFGTGSSGMGNRELQHPQSSFSQSLGSGNQLGAARGDFHRNVMRSNPTTPHYGAKQDAAELLGGDNHPGNNVELDGGEGLAGRARSHSPQKAGRPSARPSGNSENTLQSTLAKNKKEEEALKAIVNNFQKLSGTSGADATATASLAAAFQVQPQHDSTKVDGISEQNVVAQESLTFGTSNLGAYLEPRPQTAMDHGALSFSSTDPGLKPNMASQKAVSGTLGANFSFRSEAVNTRKFRNAEGLDFGKESSVTALKGEQGEQGPQLGPDFDPNKYMSLALATVASDNVNATGSAFSSSQGRQSGRRKI